MAGSVCFVASGRVKFIGWGKVDMVCMISESKSFVIGLTT